MTSTKFAKVWRAELVERACRRAVKKLGRAITADEHFIIVQAAIAFVPAPRRRCRECRRRKALASGYLCRLCQQDENAGILR